MAKDKNKEAEYKAEGLRRIAERKQKRKNNWSDKVFRYGISREAKCDDCGGSMTWCSLCQVWSRHCCVEYGTCQCS